MGYDRYAVRKEFRKPVTSPSVFSFLRPTLLQFLPFPILRTFYHDA